MKIRDKIFVLFLVIGGPIVLYQEFQTWTATPESEYARAEDCREAALKSTGRRDSDPACDRMVVHAQRLERERQEKYQAACWSKGLAFNGTVGDQVVCK